jgi:SsrA-binding protein
MAKIQSGINIQNKRASFEFAFLDKYTAGMQLTGTEIKSIRDGKANITDAFCFIRNEEVFVKNLHISEYEKGTHYNHDPLRERKLLLQKTEIQKIVKKLKDQGLTIVPLRLFIAESGYAKLEIAVSKGKKNFDKREDIKKRDVFREINRNLKKR